MHELGICQNILDFVLQNCEDKEIVRVKVAIPADVHHTPECYKNTFTTLAANTKAAQSKLEVVDSPDDEIRVIEIEVKE